MIIQLLGANGAGKSTIVGRLMSGHTCEVVKLWGRRVPDGYLLRDLTIVGHYEGDACGGADTIPRRLIDATIKRLSLRAMGLPTLVEGPTGREPTLEEPPGQLHVVYLRRTHDQCLEDWVRRNEAKGLSVNRATMSRRVSAGIVRIERMIQEYRSRGVTVTTCPERRYALETIQDLIGRKRA
jgi:hypothetical protein